MRDEEIITRIVALRDEVFRQIGQFERDKVAAEDERARMAIGNLIQQAGQLRSDQVQMQADLAALAARVTLCEGRIARLEAKP